MTESEWLTCINPQRMLEFLGAHPSTRKKRLFAVACCRRVLQWMPDRRSRRAVATAAALIEGQVDPLREQAIRRAAEDPVEEAVQQAAEAVDDAAFAAASSALAALHPVAQTAAIDAAAQAASAAYHAGSVFGRGAAADRSAEWAAQADLLRDIFCPFRALSLAEGLLVWNDRAIPRLAHTLYHDRAFELFPILADALEDAGCTDAVLLGHCRGPGPHVRGCFVLDPLLEKE
jgi:hypothetical protein